MRKKENRGSSFEILLQKYKKAIQPNKRSIELSGIKYQFDTNTLRKSYYIRFERKDDFKEGVMEKVMNLTHGNKGNM
jgi:hypothetical protein